MDGSEAGGRRGQTWCRNGLPYGSGTRTTGGVSGCPSVFRTPKEGLGLRGWGYGKVQRLVVDVSRAPRDGTKKVFVRGDERRSASVRGRWFRTKI